MKKGNPEGAVQLQILKYLRSRGYVCGKTKTMGVKRGNFYCFDPYTFRGYPDITVFMPELMFIEVKSKKGVQSEDQKAFQGYCEKAGVPYILAHSLDELVSLLQTLKG